MLKLVQIGENPKFPKEVTKYWRFTTESPPPGWLTDIAKIKCVTDFPVLDTETLGTGGIIIKSPTGNLITLPVPDSWIILDERLGLLCMTDKQKELLYEEI